MRIVIAVIVVFCLALAGFYFFSDAFLHPATPVFADSKKRVQQLKDLYEEMEAMEAKVRLLQAGGEESEQVQKNLRNLQDSIETLRRAISRQTSRSPEADSLPKRPQVFGTLKIDLFSPSFLLLVIVVLLVIILAMIFKNKAFGSRAKQKTFPGYTTSRLMRTAKAAPKPSGIAAATGALEPDEPQAPEEPLRPRPAKFEEKGAESASSLHAQILTLHGQGLSVRDISSRLKIEQDQVNLALRLHGKKPE